MDPKTPADLQKVVNLLQKLGQAEVNYPFTLLMNRRAAFLEKVSAAKALMVHTKPGVGRSGAASSAKETLIHGILVAVVVVELAVGAYVLRDQWLPLLGNQTPAPSNLPTLVFNTAEPFSTSAMAPMEFPTETITPVTTLTPAATPPPATREPSSNPVSPEKTKHDDSGKHLGQTPGPPNPPGNNKNP